jgi:hypothetical protein
VIEYLRRLYHRVQSNRREQKKRAERSPHWHKVELLHLAREPRCQGCGSKRHLQVHHEVPFHLRPDLELEPSNLITVCMDKAECHLMVAHGGYFGAYNPNVRVDLAETLAHPQRRAMVRTRAQVNRLT